ncbi:hypothetical protein [Xenorhabdus griffiniae]|uniref:hypothetical protein n=1 Tax=Xenorhabdus griffiniae TaxID=351672 RepID=UPI00235953A2|nr:hypothetical protein [Xenorhabdus griffiniae]MDC9607350.1 hypothetical protein [Xenorhabdus griffiniae]
MMKLSITSLILLIIVCAVAYSFILISSEWFLTNKSIYQLNWIKGLKLGCLIGGGIGAIIWLAYRFRLL